MIRLAPLPASLPETVPFTGPETIERRAGRGFVARLGANESRFGPSPLALATLREAAGEAWMYGDPEAYALKAAIAAHHGIAPAHIVPGEGIDGLLGLLVRLMVAPGDAVVTSAGAYPTFAFHVAGFGGVLHRAPYRGAHEDPEALLALAHATGARLVYLANPDNPMGSHHPGALVAEMVAHLPEGCLLVLDEAYVDLAPEGTAAPIAAEDPRVIRMRTFSKAYGLAGLRLGYAIAAEDLARAFDRVRNHFGLGRVVQAVGIAALADQAHLALVQAEVGRARLAFGDLAREFGLAPLASATNFLTIDLSPLNPLGPIGARSYAAEDGARARAMVGLLAEEGIFVRMPGVAPLDSAIRVSLGPEQDLAALAEALPRALARLQG
jgi:histidinol-phosphate aminotransferase